jgi:DNA-binding SARP family transcriptional activator
MKGWIDRALSASRAAGDENLTIQSLVHAANHHHWMGDRSAASLALEEIRLLSRSPDASPGHAILGMSVEASTLLWADADSEGALRVVAEGFDAARRLGASQWDHLFHAVGAYAALLAGDGKSAGEHLRKMKAALPASRRFAECQYDYLCAWHHLLRGDGLGAAGHAGRALACAEAAGSVFAEIACRLASANIAEGCGEHEEARAHLIGIGDRIRSSGNRMLRFTERLTAARIAFGSGDEAGGLSALREGMEIGRKQGYVNLFWWWEPDAMTRLCLKAMEAGIEPAYVLDLVRKRGLSPDVPPMEIPEWPWKVRIHTLGRFGVLRDGKRVGFSGKAQEKPLRLLKALIALGGRDVPRENLADAVWPDADGDRALQALAITVRRLRGVLGDEKSVLVGEGRVTLSNRVCWVDCWAFKRLFAQADKARREESGGGRPPTSAALFEKALGLYDGEFLKEEKDRPWAVTLRERLRGKFLRAVMEAGRSCEAAGEWEAALSCYRKGLEADDLHEEFHRRKMICLHRLGRRSEAEAAYQRCRRTLRAGLGVAPSAETEAVLKSIREAGEKSPEPPR